MAETSDEVKQALETIFTADSEIYQRRGFQRRIGYGTRPALIVIDMAKAWTQPGYPFTCDGMDTIIPANQALLAAAREKRIPIVFTTTAYQSPKGPHADTGLWHLKIPVETWKKVPTRPPSTSGWSPCRGNTSSSRNARARSTAPCLRAI